VAVSMDSWYRYKAIQNNAKFADLLELAKSTFFLNRTNVSGVIKGGVIGGYEQKGPYKIDVRFNKSDLIRRIEKIAQFRNRISVSNLDGVAFIKKMDGKAEDIFIYLDPPYYQKGADLYMNFYSKADHEKLSNHVHRMRKKWMVSYDNHEFILNLYAVEKKIIYRIAQNTSNRVGDEVLIFSNQITFQQSMEALSSPVCL
jgi:DNA adenine methylase